MVDCSGDVKQGGEYYDDGCSNRDLSVALGEGLHTHSQFGGGVRHKAHIVAARYRKLTHTGRQSQCE